MGVGIGKSFSWAFLDLGNKKWGALCLEKTLLEKPRLYQVYSCPMFTPCKQGSKLDKKGFCKDILTKQTHLGQETLTGLGQESLTMILVPFFFWF